MRDRSWVPILFAALVTGCGGSLVPTPGAPAPAVTISPPSATAPAVTTAGNARRNAPANRRAGDGRAPDGPAGDARASAVARADPHR